MLLSTPREMKNCTSIATLSALTLVLFISPVFASDAPPPLDQTTGTAPPVLRVVDSAATELPDGEFQLIHPWDNPQRYDSTHSRGPVSGLKPLTRDGAPEVMAGKYGAMKPVIIDAVTNYPNPFNAQTRVEFRLAVDGPVELTVFNLLGQSVRLIELGDLTSGTHSWIWDGMMEGGRPAPSGIYFYRISSGASSAMNKMVLLK